MRDGEVDLSYHTFLEMFKYRIIYYIMKIEDVTLSKAYNTWKRAAIFDEKVYNIMQYMIKNEKIKVLINRNPTLKIIDVIKLL